MTHFYSYGFLFLSLINFISFSIIFRIYFRQSRTLDSEVIGFRSKPPQKIIEIETSLGQIAGFQQTSSIFNGSIATFLGVPYAQAPIGKLRFKPARLPVKWWPKVLKAFHWPKPCMQPDHNLQLNNFNFSEDCLYLNIWFNSMRIEQNQTLLPVLVIIHTGAFVFGSASETKYDGIYLAAKTNSVVVTLNYRLNFYGFYYSINDSIQSNLGLGDQLMALKWIHQHIHKFHGDRNRITLIGQSSAALSIGLHISSPQTSKLFQQAIMMSGSPFQLSMDSSRPENVDEFWRNYLRYLKCDPKIGMERIIKCFDRKIASNRNNLISMKMVKELSSLSNRLFVNLPLVTDETFQFTDQSDLIDRLKSTLRSNRISILYGRTNDEGSWISMLERPEIFDPQSPQSMNEMEAKNIGKKFIDLILVNRSSINASKILGYYFEELLKIQPESSEDLILHRIISRIVGDRYINCPMEIFVETVRTSTRSKAYQYYWQYKGNKKTSAFWNTFERVWCGYWMGSCHSFEMYAIFGVPFLQPNLFDQSDRIVSYKTIEMIEYFITKKQLFWPALSNRPDHQNLFYNIDDNIDGKKFGFNRKHQECSKIWGEYFQNIYSVE
ncbi:Receptor-type tyrosine-protein phosphatase kappa [Sarcoptes scabiei]|nr:Receptor-type tyrosine-protein phosphatase kappa [Sarcoptes scabiei]